AHVLGEGNQRLTLLRSSLLVDQHHRLCRVGAGIRIADGRTGFYSGNHGEPIEALAIPGAVVHVPCQKRLVASEVDFAVGEALSDVHIGTAALEIVAADLLLRLAGKREGSQEQSGKERSK